MADKNKLKVWLDQQIAIRELELSLKEFSDDIRVIEITKAEEIHCVGVNEIASRLGFTVYNYERIGEYVRRYFIYRGYTFFEMVKVPLEDIVAEDEE